MYEITDTMETEIIICECNSPTHQIVVTHDTELKLVYLEVFLNREHRFFHRIIKGLKYIFGQYPSELGMYAEIILSKKDASKFLTIYNTLNNESNDRV